jgi:hypothetical protein
VRRWCWRSLSIAVAIAYVVVLAAHAVVWPWAVLLGLMAGLVRRRAAALR